jgi:hypothetical protein
MTSMAESTASKEPEAKRNEGISSPRTQESAGEQDSGLFSRVLSGAPGEPALGSAARLLGDPLFSHSANNGQRVIALKRAQQTYGNGVAQRAVARIQRKPTNSRMVQRECVCGGTCEGCREASSALSTVKPASIADSSLGVIQGKAANADGFNTPNSQEDKIIPSGSSGQPLDARTLAFMESRFGEDFSEVQVHTDDKAAASAEALNANAYTSGRDIYFGRGKYAPETPEGQNLLAHELTHTIQQSERMSPMKAAAHTSNGIAVRRADDPLEQEADRAADAVLAGAVTEIAPDTAALGHVQRKPRSEPRDVFAGKSYDLKTNKGVLEMAQDWQTQFIQDWSSFATGSKEKMKAGRVMAIYTEHFLRKFQKAAEEGAKPEVLTQEVLAGVNRSIAAGETEVESKKYIDFRSYRTWFPEHFASEYFDEANKLRREQRSEFAILERYKLQHLDDAEEYAKWAEYQYVDGLTADMLDEEGKRILGGKWDVLLLEQHRLFFSFDARPKARALGRKEWEDHHARGDAAKVKTELANTQYAEIARKLAELVGLKRGLLTGATPAEQEPWIDGRIDDLIAQLRQDFGIQMNRAKLLDSVTAGTELRVLGGRIDRSPNEKPYFGQRMTFRAELDYMPPGKTVRIGWRWKVDSRESRFLVPTSAMYERTGAMQPLTLEAPFWTLEPDSLAKAGGFKVMAHVYVGDEDKPATTLETGWIELPRTTPTEVRILEAPEKTVQGAPVKFGFGPWIPSHGQYAADWYVDDELKAGNSWGFTHRFGSTGEHTVVLKLSQVEGWWERTKKPLLESPPVKITVLDATQFGESVLSQLDTPLVPGMSPGTLAQLATSTESSIKELERRVATAGDDREHWESRLKNQRERLRKIHELVPDLARAETLPEDKLNLETGRLYSAPISSVLIHPEKGITLPLAIYLTVQSRDSAWSASLIDATSSKVLRYSGSGSTPQDAYVSAFSSWQSDNEYPTGGQVVYRFDPVIFKGEGHPDRRSFSTSTPWKKAKDWWDGILTVGGIIVGGLLLLAPEAAITKALAIALLAAATARSVVAIKERMEVGYEALDKENILDGISIAASVTGIGGTLIKTAGLRAVRPLITRVGDALIITSAAADVGTFLYASSEAIAALRAIDADPTLDDAQKQVELLRVMATLFVSGALLVASNKDLLKGGSPSIKSKLEPGAKIELDAATRVDMELELRETGEHESFLKAVEGMDQAARDRALIERLIDVRARVGLKPTPENVWRVNDPKFSADYDAEITIAEHTYRRSKENGRWCRFSKDPVCGINLNDINSEVDVALAPKPVVEPDQPPKASIEAITTDPGPQVAPTKPGAAPGALPAGTAAHKAARWAEYQKGGGKWSYERWSDLYEASMLAKRAEIQKEVSDLEAKKEAAQTRANDLKKKAQENEVRAKELDRQAAIAKGDAQTQLRGQWRQARDAADQASKDADAAFKEVVDAQLQIQKKNAQLNTDARSRLPCFAAGTAVWTPSGPCEIDKLQVHDVVLAYDFESRSTVQRHVLEVYKNRTMRFYHIEVNGTTIRATSLHRFWVSSEHTWIEARYLRAGMELQMVSGETAHISRIDVHEAPHAASFNLHIEENFTYFVGAGVLVHNQGGPSYSFGNLRIYAGVNPNFPGYVYIGQTDDLAAREGQHRAEAIRELKKPNLTKEQREFWEFKRDIVLEERVSGLNQDQANYLEQKNKDIETDALGEDKVMNRREQVSRKNMPQLEKKIMEDPKVKAAGLCP